MDRKELIAKFEEVRAEHSHAVFVFHFSQDRYSRAVYLHESIELYETAKDLIRQIEMET